VVQQRQHAHAQRSQDVEEEARGEPVEQRAQQDAASDGLRAEVRGGEGSVVGCGSASLSSDKARADKGWLCAPSARRRRASAARGRTRRSTGRVPAPTVPPRAHTRRPEPLPPQPRARG
jgi:hypothetical protein